MPFSSELDTTEVVSGVFGSTENAVAVETRRVKRWKASDSQNKEMS